MRVFVSEFSESRTESCQTSAFHYYSPLSTVYSQISKNEVIMFKPVSPKLNLISMEEGVLRFWKHRHIFDKSGTRRQGAPEYVFYEGPPTANGKPGVHHVLARVFKDIFPRYKTMRGFHVVRRGGWDTHGLPVEIEVEKKMGFTHKGQIEENGIGRCKSTC